MASAVSERPNVAFFMPSLRGGGAERVMLDLARGVASRGYSVDVVVLNRVDAVTDDLGAGVNLVDLERTRAASAFPALVSYLRRRRPPVMLSTLEHTNVLAVIATKFVGGTRLVLREASTQGEDLAGEAVKGRAVRMAMRVTYRGAAGIIAVSRGVAASLSATLRLDPTRIEVIASPVITERLREGVKGSPAHPWFGDGGEPIFLGVGRLVRHKGFDTLLRAFAIARERVPSRLLILGEGELRAQLTDLADSLGVTDAFQLPGFVPNPFPYMANCDLFVLSSRLEGLPNVLIQAMAAGAKVVATDCRSGPHEVLDGGELGILVPVDDADALANAMVKGLASERRALPDEWFERYDAEAVVDRYLRALGLPPHPNDSVDPSARAIPLSRSPGTIQ